MTFLRRVAWAERAVWRSLLMRFARKCLWLAFLCFRLASAIAKVADKILTWGQTLHAYGCVMLTRCYWQRLEDTRKRRDDV